MFNFRWFTKTTTSLIIKSADEVVFNPKFLDTNQYFLNYATTNSIGVDLYADIDKPMVLQPHSSNKIKTGVYTKNVNSFIMSKSGLATKNIFVLGGVIDADYKDELCVILTNNGLTPFTVNPGDKIAQLVKLPTDKFNNIPSQQKIRDGGFGSTGK